MKRLLLAIFSLLLSFQLFASAEIIISQPRIAGGETRYVEVGASPKVYIQFKNNTDNVIQLGGADIYLIYDPNVIDNIIGISNENPNYFSEKEMNISNPGEIIYKIESGAKKLSVRPGATVNLAGITFHVKQTATPRGVRLFDFSTRQPSSVLITGVSSDITSATAIPLAVSLSQSAPPKFSGFSQIISSNTFGSRDSGNTLILDWRTPGSGAQDLTKYFNGKLNYRIFRNTADNFGPDSGAMELSVDTSHGEMDDPAMRAPFTGNVPGTDYLYQDGGEGNPLSDGTTYYYKISALDDTSPMPNESAGSVRSGTPLDLTPPGNVANLSAQAEDNRIILTWDNPTDPDFAGVVIIKNEASPVGSGYLESAKAVFPYDNGREYQAGEQPFGEGSGKVIYVSFPGDTSNRYEDFDVIKGRNYYYRIFTFDRVVDGMPREMGRNYSGGAAVNMLAGKAPRPISNFTASRGAAPGEVVFSWNNSPDEFCEGVLIRYTSDDALNFAALGDQNAGELVGAFPDNSGPGKPETYSVIFPPGLNYYFKAFAYNSTPPEGLDPFQAQSLSSHCFSPGQTAAVRFYPAKAAMVEQAPRVEIWIDHRLYQEELVKRGESFIVTPNPKIEVKYSASETYALSSNLNDYRITVDPEKTTAMTLAAEPQSQTKVMAAGAAPGEEKIQALNLRYLSLTEPLSEGKHTLVISAKSGGTVGEASVFSKTLIVEVTGGPLRLIGVPLTNPSPFSIRKDKTVTIQYELSASAAVEVYLISVNGERMKKFSFDSGSEGGSAGINKITWDGKTDQGYLVGNGIYVGTIVSRDDSRLLGKFKLTIAD